MKALITFLILFAAVYNAQQTLPLSINDYGLIFLEAEVNGKAGKFILDTGGGAHVVSQSFFTKINSEVIEDGIYTGFRHNGERIDLKVYKAEKISVGDLTQPEPFLGVYPPLDEYGIDGLISLKLFEETPFTIDFINNNLILETDESLAALIPEAQSLPILFDRERDKVLDMFIDVCINDTVTIQAEFDTGAGFTAFFLNEYYSEKLGLQLDSLNRSSLEKISLCGNDKVLKENKSVTVKPDLIYEGLIGSEIFRDKKLTIDIPNSRILVRENNELH